MGAPNLRYVPEQYGEEAIEVGGCGDIGTDAESFIGEWDAADGGAII